ncbi:EF-hand domain-containing protein [Phenylobacterium montanum]|uniref:EF-hand domain-containing protein n=1 Tax=Phenylobacterium montanum TaxID=2823693 RepID=A0A975G5E8_9CAUL|nr:EF-hand domain-containing protein [Caulobacter sp. S6]
MRPGLVLLAALSLAACASDEPPRGEGPQGGRGPPRPHGPQLFISPAGEPFRAGPDQPYPSAAWFARADANHDGRLDRAEVRADATGFFHVLDANHDGVIDSFEISDYEQKIAPEILGAYLGDAGRSRGEPAGQSRSGEGGGRRGHGGRRGGEGQGQGEGVEAPGGGYEGAAPFELTDEPEPVAAADLNVSGRITLKEFLQTVDRRFDEIDVGHTGSIAFADLPKTPVQRQGAPTHGQRGGPQGKPPPPPQ